MFWSNARVVLELFDQIENDIGRERLQFLPQQIDIIKDGEMLRCVPERAERVHDVRLGFPIFRFQFVAEILVDGGRTCAVEKHENFEFLFHVLFSSAVILSGAKLQRSRSPRGQAFNPVSHHP